MDTEARGSEISEAAPSTGERDLKAITDLSPVGIYRTNAEGHITYVNDRWREIMDIEAEAAYGAGWIKAMHPDDRQSTIDAWQGYIEGKREHYEIDCRIIRTDGSVTWLKSQTERDFNDKGGFIGCVGTLTDVTDLKETQLALEQRESDLRIMAMFSPVAVCRTNLEGHVVQANETWKQMVRLEDDQGMGDGWAASLHPDDKERVIEDWQATVADGSEYINEFRLTSEDDQERWVLGQLKRELDQNGTHVGYVGSTTDITERKLAEQALAASEQRFSLAMEGSNDGLWDWDLVTNRVYYSPRWFAIIGYESGELPSTPETWEKLLHPEDRPQVEAFHQRCLATTHKSNEVEFRFRHKAGHDVDILARGFAVRGDNGEPVRLIGTHSDNSARKAAEKDALAARNKAENASRAKSEFLSSMSHELRTPMNAILGYAQLLEVDQSGRLGDDQKSFVAEIMRSGYHMLELINGVLNLAKIEENDVPLELQDQDPGTVISACLSMIEAVAEQHKVTVVNRALDGDLPLIRVDALRFRQALLNLLSNGIKYNHPGGELVVDCEIAKDGLFRIRVADTGPGIDKKLWDRVFEPFDRLGAENSSTPGTGIGLSVSKQLVRSMAGDIGLDSTVGKGSTFWIDVPLSDPNQV
jgi:PAS domain S-box-containing protein